MEIGVQVGLILPSRGPGDFGLIFCAVIASELASRLIVIIARGRNRGSKKCDAYSLFKILLLLFFLATFLISFSRYD